MRTLETRLRALLEAHCRAPSLEILGRLQEAIATFSAGTPQHDDITMMVLGYQEASATAFASADVAESTAQL